MSAIQNPRPCVAATISLSRGWILQVHHRRGRQSGHEALPALSAVRGDVSAHVGSDEQQVAVLEVLANHVREVRPAGRQVRRDRLEALPAVGRDEHIRREVVAAVIVVRHVEGERIEVRRLDARDVRAGRNARHVLRELVPAAAVVPRHPEAAIVRAGVEDPRPDRRIVRATRSFANVSAPVASVVMPPVVCVETRIFIVSAYERSGEIGYISSPRLRRLQHAVRPEVQHLRIVLRDEERRVPVPAQVEIDRVALLLRAIAVEPLLLVLRERLASCPARGPRSNPPTVVYCVRHVGFARPNRSPVATIQPADVAALRFAVDDVRSRSGPAP